MEGILGRESREGRADFARGIRFGMELNRHGLYLLFSYGLLEHVRIDRKLAGPAEKLVSAVVAVHRERTFDGTSGLGRAIHFDGTPHVAVHRIRAIPITAIACRLVQREPAVGDLDASGQAGPWSSSAPAGIQATGQKAVVTGREQSVGGLARSP